MCPLIFLVPQIIKSDGYSSLEPDQSPDRRASVWILRCPSLCVLRVKKMLHSPSHKAHIPMACDAALWKLLQSILSLRGIRVIIVWLMYHLWRRRKTPNDVMSLTMSWHGDQDGPIYDSFNVTLWTLWYLDTETIIICACQCHSMIQYNEPYNTLAQRSKLHIRIRCHFVT